jgi:hypothetical protein
MMVRFWSYKSTAVSQELLYTAVAVEPDLLVVDPKTGPESGLNKRKSRKNEKKTS